MNRREAAEYLISRMVDDRIVDVDQTKLLHDGIGDELSEAIRTLNLAMTANGALYKRDEIGVIPSIIVGYYAERKEVKQEMLSVEGEIEEIKSELERRRVTNKKEADVEYKSDRKRYKI
jgi:hypothetical protein